VKYGGSGSRKIVSRF